MSVAPLFVQYEGHAPAGAGGVTLRPYQAEAVDAICDAFSKHRSTLAVLPTGCGKTIIFASVIDRMKSGRAMVLAHREELIHQAADKIASVTGRRPEIEMAGYWADESSLRRSPVVVSSIQTQVAGKGGGRMRRFQPEDFELVIVDEAHHAVARSYRRVLDHYRRNPACRVLGVTATPDRSDEAALGRVFEHVAYVYEIPDAIRDGWLVPVVQQVVHVEGLDFSSVRTTAGDLNGADLAAIMEYERNLHEIARPTIELADGRKTLVFAASVAHAERLCEIFNRYHADSARWVSGETPKDERRAVLRDYAEGRFSILCNVGVFTEGFDEPGIELVAIARPTKSRALYAQMVGRGTRPLPGTVDGIEDAGERREAIRQSSKPRVEVIDFVGNAGRHKLITTADILGGNYDDEVVDRAAARARKAGKPTNTLELLEEAEAEIHEERKRREAEERARRHIRAEATYRTRTIDPFDVLDIEPPRVRGWDLDRKPTQKQCDVIRRMTKGRVDPMTMSATEASALITKLIERSRHNWCTFAQAAFLKRYGYEPKGIRFDEARQLIDAIKQNGWKRPDVLPSASNADLPKLEAF